MVKLHERARTFMERQDKRYAERANRGKEGRLFVEGDLVWVHLRKERINDNAYDKSNTFNISNLSPQ
ncbi:hypothetical protein CR513_44043, partial [Mucuna pruriens]